MAMKNRYAARARISEPQFRHIVRLFALDLNTTRIADLAGLNRYLDVWRGYNGLVDVGYGKHLRVNHGQDEFVRGKTQINGIEGFRGFAKSRLYRFRGVNKLVLSTLERM